MTNADQIDTVRKIMTDAGLTNVAIKESVAFFSAPDSAPRVDFLRVDTGTMQKLLANAVDIRIRDHDLKVPALKDLLAMKIFALSQDTARRMGKDLPDIAYLTVVNELALVTPLPEDRP